MKQPRPISTPASKRTAPRRHAARVAVAFAAISLGFSACTVGPDYVRPETTAPAEWIGVRESTSPGGLSAAPAALAKWWTILGDPTLDSLVERALSGNLSLVEAQARVRQARAARTIAASAGLPAVDASASYTRSRAARDSGDDGNDLFRAGFDASWEIDVFGGVRRSVEAADASIAASIEDARDVRVTLLAELATTYIDLRADQEQLAIAQRNLAAQRQTLDLTQRRQAAGFVSRLDVVNAQTQVANTESRLPSLEASIHQSMYALATLLGTEPGSLIEELASAMPLAALPPEVPAGLPSELLERRPDIRRSEAELHLATAQVGVAVADLYPRFSLSGAFGLQGGEVSALGTLADRFWSIGPAVQWPIFQGGALRANVEQQRAAADAAVAAYKASILSALQEVESTMIAYDREQKRTLSLDQSVQSSQESVSLSSDLYEAGRIDFLNVLTAQRSLLDAESSRLDSRRLTLTNLIALYKALGGGWDVDAPSEAAAVAPPPRDGSDGR